MCEEEGGARTKMRACKSDGEGDNDDVIVAWGQQRCHCCVVRCVRMKVRAMVRVCEDGGKCLKGDDKGDGDNNNNIVTQGQQRCRCHCCVVGCLRMRVRAMARVCEDEGDSEDNDDDIVAWGQHHCHRHHHCHVVGCLRTRVRAMVRVCKDKGLKGNNEGEGDGKGV